MRKIDVTYINANSPFLNTTPAVYALINSININFTQKILSNNNYVSG